MKHVIARKFDNMTFDGVKEDYTIFFIAGVHYTGSLTIKGSKVLTKKVFKTCRQQLCDEISWQRVFRSSRNVLPASRLKL